MLLMSKSTISMAMFNSYVKLPEGRYIDKKMDDCLYIYMMYLYRQSYGYVDILYVSKQNPRRTSHGGLVRKNHGLRLGDIITMMDLYIFIYIYTHYQSYLNYIYILDYYIMLL